MSATMEMDKNILVLPDLPALLSGAADAAHAFVAAARPHVKARISSAGGKVDRVLADVEQHGVHGCGWGAAYAEMLREVASWAASLDAQGSFGEIEALLAQLLFAEYGAQMLGGIGCAGQQRRQIRQDQDILVHLHRRAHPSPACFLLADAIALASSPPTSLPFIS